jgi:hypothetical protein
MNAYIHKEYTKYQHQEDEMNNLFNEISNIRFAVTGPTLSDKEIIIFQKELIKEGYNPLPNEIITFLKKYNGFLFENRCIWGINPNKKFRYDIIGENNLAENPTPENLTILGSTETTYIGWHKSSDSYSMIDKYDFSVIHKFNNFPNAIRYILKIDD